MRNRQIENKLSYLVLACALTMLPFAWVGNADAMPNSLSLSDVTDFDNDGLGDIAYHDPSNAVFSIRGSSTIGFTQIGLGGVGDVGVVGDFDGDGKADLATFNRTTATWTVLLQGAATPSSQIFGIIGDVPVPGSYSQANCTDLATYSVKTGVFRIKDCESGATRSVTVGKPGGLPASGDFDCDGLDDPATYHPHERRWTINRSSDSTTQSFVYGLWFDQPATSDFVGMGCEQPALYRPLGKFFIYGDSVQGGGSPTTATIRQWGLSEDRFALLNVDGDVATDFSITRSTDGNNYLFSSLGFFFPVPIGTGGGSTSKVSTISPPFNGGLPNYTSGNVPVSAATLLHPLYNVEGDYNRDGRADFALATVDRTNNLTNFRVLLNTGQDVTFQVNASGDAFVPADYNGDGKTQPAVVYVNGALPANANLEWHIANPSGAETVEVFGVNGNRPIVGDFDCDGKADKAVIREANGFLMWDIDISTNDSLIVSRNFGLSGDKAFVADVNGDFCDELIVARELGGGITWFMQRLEDGTPQGPITLETVSWGLVGDNLLTPSDMDGDRKADIIVSRPGADGLVHTYVRKTTEGPNPFPGPAGFGLHCDVVAPGQYDGLNFGKLAVYRRGSGSFYVDRFFGQYDTVPHGSGNEIVIRPDGTAVQNNGEGRIVAAGGTCSGDGGGNTGGGNSGGVPGGGLEDCTSISGYSDGAGGGALWKPISEATHTVVTLMPPQFNVPAVMVGRDGNVVSTTIRQDCCSHNGGRAHHWWSKHPGELTGVAPVTVKYFLGGGVVDCRTVQNPFQRYD